MSMELLTITIAAGENKHFAKAGRYFEIIDAAYAVDVTMYSSAGSMTDFAKGALSGIYIAADFVAFELRSTLAQTVTIMVSDRGGGSRRQPGNVRIIDNGADKTRALSQFTGIINHTPGATRFAIAGVMAIGRELTLKRIVIGSNVTGNLVGYTCTGAPTLNALGNNPLVNKYIGAPVANGARVYGDAAAATPTVGELPGRSGVGYFQVTASQSVEYPLTTPIVLPAGSGLVFVGPAANALVMMTIDAEE